MALIGIDLGTSNSLIAYFNGEKAEIIKNEFEENTTPSIVGVDDNGEILIGKVAKERLLTHPKSTAAVFKRFMGTDKEYNLGNNKLTAIDLSAFILKTLKEDAEKFLGESCDEAVISVPAYFNNKQRQATIDAAKIAGLKVERIISEPTAAAIAYGLHEKEDDTTFMVLDLGGGTFDVSILEVFDGVMQVVSISGDNFLGGEDFTEIIMKNFIKKNKIDEYLEKEEYALLHEKAEICKISVCESGYGKIAININGNDYTYELDEEEFSRISQDLLERIKWPIIRTLKDAEVSVDELEAIVLIGGATKMPIIRSFVAKLFRKLPYTNINPDETVAIGATIQAALKERHDALSEVILTDVCPYTLGIETVENSGEDILGGIFLPLIERNTTIPVSKIKTVYTILDDQQHVKISIYQGESRKIKENLKLGELEFKLDRKPKDTPIDVRFTYDKNGVLEVLAEVNKCGKYERLILKNTPGTLTDEEIEESLSKLSKLKIHPKERNEIKYLLDKANRLYSESLGEDRNYIGFKTSQFEILLESQDEKKIKKECKEFEKFLKSFEFSF